MEPAQEHFTKRAAKYNKSSNWVADETLIKRLFDLCETTKDSIVLDLATGTGLIAKQFRGTVKKVVGIDINADMVERSKGCMDEMVFGAVEKMPFADATFDAVVCRQGLQFAELDKAIPEIYRVLKPEGVVVLCHLTAYDERDRELTFRIQELRNPSRRNYLMPPDISNALRKQGFREVQDIEYRTDESVNQWIDHGAIPAERMDAIRRAYRSSDATFRSIHNIRFTADDILDTMLLVIAKARKQ
jgi:SAM-dependent methyltransferase